MTSKNILKIEHFHSVVYITLNRPDFGNALNHDLIIELTRGLQEINNTPAVRVVCLKGAGKHFCSGGDLVAMRQLGHAPKEQNITEAKKLATLMQTLQQLNKITIAMIQGAAYGGAVGLISCCDIAIGSDNAQFCFPEARLGIVPAIISPFVTQTIGERYARYHFLNTQVFNAARALHIGLIHEVVRQEDLFSHTTRLVNYLLQNGPNTTKIIKNLFTPVTTEQLQQCAALLAETRASAEGQEGLTAFLEKRAPNWIIKEGNHDD